MGCLGGRQGYIKWRAWRTWAGSSDFRSHVTGGPGLAGELTRCARWLKRADLQQLGQAKVVEHLVVVRVLGLTGFRVYLSLYIDVRGKQAGKAL